MAQKIRVELLYDRIKNETLIYTWQGMTLLDTDKRAGTVSNFVKDKILKQMIKKYKD